MSGGTIKNFLKRVFLIFVAIVIVLCIAVWVMFGKEINTINSIEKVDDAGMFMMDYQADYGLDKLLEKNGVSSDGELVSFVARNLLKGLPLEFNIPIFGCSTFQAQNDQGDWTFSRNYDLNYVPSMIVRTNPKNGYASISVSNMSVLGYSEEKLPTNFKNSIMSLAAPYAVMDGMNEEGFSIGVLLIKDYAPTNQQTEKLDLTTTSAIRYLLDKAANVQEAITLLENMDMHASANASYHFQMADASGNSAIIEYIDNELRVMPKQQGDIQALTNFLVSEDVYGHGSGKDRYDIVIDTLTSKNGIMSEQESMDLLEAVSLNKVNGETGTLTATQWSVVYNNTKKTAQLVAGGNFDRVINISFEK